jgi:hypothetical protein
MSDSALTNLEDNNPHTETIHSKSEDSVTEPVEQNHVETIIDLLKKSFENEDIKNKISISLTPEIISIINNIISLTPNTLTDIEKVIIEIIKDGKINSKDVPNIIIVIQKIYQFIYSLKNVKFDTKKRANVTSELLKYLIHLLVLERKIKIDTDKQADFLTLTDALIDSCISLLSYSKTLKTKVCFRKLF